MKEKSSKKIVLFILGILILLTAIMAAVHLTSREKNAEGTIAIEIDGKTSYIDLTKLDTIKVEGTVINGKGQERVVNSDGVLLKDLIPAKEIDTVSVFAADEYSADISAEELEQEDKIYLLVEDSKGNLVVFGDKNSKRNVSDVVKIIVK